MEYMDTELHPSAVSNEDDHLMISEYRTSMTCNFSPHLTPLGADLTIKIGNYLQNGMKRYAAFRRAGDDELTALGMAFPESSKPKDSGGKKGSLSSGTSNPPPLNPQVNPTNVTGMFTRSS
jgi:hypothetical protein